MTSSMKCALSLLVLVLLTRSSVRAEPTSPTAVNAAGGEPAGYRELIDEAVQEFGAHHYEESRSLFAHAHGLFPSARTHRGLGLTEFELRNYGECIKQLEAALRSTVKPLPDDLRAQTERTLARAYNYVARVVVDAKPGGSAIVLDGMPVEVPAGQALLLQIGEHTLEVSAVGFAPERRHLSVQGGDDRRVTIILAQNQAADSKPPPADHKEKQSRWYKSPWLWVGVVVAGAAAGTAVALTRDPKEPAPYGGSSNTVVNAP